MHEGLGLKTLAAIMEWDDDSVATREYDWLRLMSRFKYDAYSDYTAGVRFIENLVIWLQQFSPGPDRQRAYDYVKQSLIYISSTEMNKLVALFYKNQVEPELIRRACSKFDIPTYEIWTHREARQAFRIARRRTLFMGLSDGARIDVLRYATTDALVHDQMVNHYQLDAEKWRDLKKKLDAFCEPESVDSHFRAIYVLDDLVASGTTLLRKDPDTDEWTGKLCKLRESINNGITAVSNLLSDDWELHVHHYIGNAPAIEAIKQRANRANDELSDDKWYRSVEFSFGMTLPSDIAIREDDPFFNLIEKYYDPSIEPKKHLEQSGIPDLKRGYANCGLPLVLEHNTPNNSLPILWARSAGQDDMHAMRPLFYRRQRHG